MLAKGNCFTAYRISIVSPLAGARGNDHDVALAQTDRELGSSSWGPVGPICLPEAGAWPQTDKGYTNGIAPSMKRLPISTCFQGVALFNAGWGRLRDDRYDKGDEGDGGRPPGVGVIACTLQIYKYSVENKGTASLKQRNIV